jgi:hypothetical protein
MSLCHISGFIGEVDFLERENVVVFYYLSASEICPNKRGSLWWR